MSWSYLADFTTTRDQLRFLVGDTEENHQQLQDGELDWVLSQQSDLYLAAALVCDTLAVKLAKRPESISIVGQSASMSRRIERYHDQADRFRAEAGRHGGAGAVTVGALVVLESRALEDAAGVTPAFHRNQFGYAGAV